jgi:hypothetical protein
MKAMSTVVLVGFLCIVGISAMPWTTDQAALSVNVYQVKWPFSDKAEETDRVLYSDMPLAELSHIVQEEALVITHDVMMVSLCRDGVWAVTPVDMIGGSMEPIFIRPVVNGNESWSQWKSACAAIGESI